jgi:HrpA-like RNA helicase
MIKQKNLFKFLLKRNFRFRSQNYSTEFKNLEKEHLSEKQPPSKPTENKEKYKIFEAVKAEVKSHPAALIVAIIALIVAIIETFVEQPWTSKNSLPLIPTKFEPLIEPTKYIPRNKIEQKITELLNKSQLIIVYGPKTSGKSTTVNQIWRPFNARSN